ncbi:MAG: hypothetical protein PWR10_1565 [Halanaerobiales bacterium]|nr:hypothetical protein [Halanaerobiales bacterium]
MFPSITFRKPERINNRLVLKQISRNGYQITRIRPVQKSKISPP